MPPVSLRPQDKFPQVKQSQRLELKSQSLHFAIDFSAIFIPSACCKVKVCSQGNISISQALISSFWFSEAAFNIEVTKLLISLSFSYSKDFLHIKHLTSKSCSHSSPEKSAPPGLPIASFVICFGSWFFSSFAFFFSLIFNTIGWL